MSDQHSLPRLLVLASTYPRWAGDHEPGFVHELSSRLVNDFNVTVLCPHAHGAKTREKLCGVDVVRFRYAPGWLERLVNNGGILANLRRHRWLALLLPSFFLAQLVYTFAFLLRHRPAVIHAHWILPQAFIAVLANCLSRRSTPILVTSHGADLFALNGNLMRRIKTWTLSHCMHASVVSHAMLEPLHALGMPKERTTVAPMGVDMDRFCTSASTERARYELLFVGRLVEKKGFRYLLDALPYIIEKYPKAILTVVGFGPELAERQAQAARLGLQDHVHFAGACAQSDLPAYYRRATMLVAPFVQAATGDREGLGLVSVEALACGCPVVTTRIDAIKEVFNGKWPPYLAEPSNPRSLADQIIRVLDQPMEASTWAGQQLHSLQQQFHWSSVALGYIRLLTVMNTRAA